MSDLIGEAKQALVAGMLKQYGESKEDKDLLRNVSARIGKDTLVESNDASTEAVLRYAKSRKAVKDLGYADDSAVMKALEDGFLSFTKSMAANDAKVAS